MQHSWFGKQYVTQPVFHTKFLLSIFCQGTFQLSNIVNKTSTLTFGPNVRKSSQYLLIARFLLNAWKLTELSKCSKQTQHNTLKSWSVAKKFVLYTTDCVIHSSKFKKVFGAKTKIFHFYNVENKRVRKCKRSLHNWQGDRTPDHYSMYGHPTVAMSLWFQRVPYLTPPCQECKTFIFVKNSSKTCANWMAHNRFAVHKHAWQSHAWAFSTVHWLWTKRLYVVWARQDSEIFVCFTCNLLRRVMFKSFKHFNSCEQNKYMMFEQRVAQKLGVFNDCVVHNTMRKCCQNFFCMSTNDMKYLGTGLSSNVTVLHMLRES